MATIADVARRAGVATSTVSHVLNGTRYVSAETTRAVREAVDLVGYTPNSLARALARRTTNLVGLAVSSTRNRYFADVINAVEEQCAEQGMMVLLANTKDDAAAELAAVQALHQRRVDGVIIASCCDPELQALSYLRSNQVPAVLLDRLPEFPLDGVGVENTASIAALVDHLVGLGHRRIGFLGGQAEFTTARERLDGFKLGLDRHAIPYEDRYAATGVLNAQDARAAALRMLGENGRVTALIGGNNLTTIGIMLAARSLSLQVPGDLAVIGFDDFDWAEAFVPRLSVMVQPCIEIGRAAAQLLRRRILTPSAAHETIRLSPTLAIRDSCGGSRTMKIKG